MVNEYNVLVNQIESNTFSIYKIVEKAQDKGFSLLWVLNGFLIDINTKTTIEIFITKISATGITFNITEEENIVHIDQTYLSAIVFEDETKIGVMGNITKSIKINNTIHYEFVFVNLKEDAQAQIYQQLFQKQISIRNQLK